MKSFLQILIVCGLAFLCSSFTINHDKLGTKLCSYGPGFWCQSIQNAKSCRAVTHCIQTVWEKQNIPKDVGPICKLCLDMVDEAREQLESNETIGEIEQVFDGSCDLMPFKIVKKECKVLAHDFIIELVDTLESEMNSQMVCATAGLCNNAKIDKMLENQKSGTELSCARCKRVGSIITKNVQSADQDDILEGLLNVCGSLSSFSDACSSIIITNFNDIYIGVQESVTTKNICALSGDCSRQLYDNSEVSFEISEQIKDDIPCELCEQLVHHLKDLLIANTTELEFKHVLEGLCKQTRAFSTQCVNIVDQYYAEIYELITKSLDPNGACFMMGVCPKGDSNLLGSTVSMPLVNVNLEVPQFSKNKLGKDEASLSDADKQWAELPIDDLLLHVDDLVSVSESTSHYGESKYCILCEYISHMVQETIDQPKNEENIKKVVSKICDKLPKGVQSKCHAFVKLYGDSLISLLSQQFDSKLICPELLLCPKSSENFLPDPGFMVPVLEDDKSTCPLCLFAMQEAQQLINTTKTKDNIVTVLNNLCSHLSVKMVKQCNEFVGKYSTELIDMLIADLTPQEICVYLKLCVDKEDDLSFLNVDAKNEDSSYNVMTNEISDNTVYGQKSPVQSLPQCELCKEIIRIVEKQIVNKNSKAEIMKALENSCSHMKTKFAAKCKELVDKFADTIIDMIQSEFKPEEICHDLMLCDAQKDVNDESDDALIVSIAEKPSNYQFSSKEGPPCIMCEFIMTKLDAELKDKKTDKEIKDTVRSICARLPNTVGKPCTKFIDQYGDMIILLIDEITPAQMCHKLKLCSAALEVDVKNDVVQCGICQGVVQAFGHILSDPTVDQKIEHIEERACEVVPGKYYKKCAEMIDIYGYSIVNLLKSLTNNDEICYKIGMCYKESNSGFVQLL